MEDNFSDDDDKDLDSVKGGKGVNLQAKLVLVCHICVYREGCECICTVGCIQCLLCVCAFVGGCG